MQKRYKWAILGTGKIANRFAASLNNIPERAELLAIGSRSAEAGNTFGDKYHIPKRYIGYEEVVADPEVDIVYIGTPGVFHKQHVSMCLEAGKHVLCEKAFTINAREAEDLIRLARRKKLFLMEAMWTRFFPIHVKIRELLASNAIGKINGMVVNFMAKPPFDVHNRFFDLGLGAGVLMDTGSYGISWAYSLLGKPEKVTGLAYFGESGADYSSASILKYPAGQIVTITCSQISYDAKEAVIFGSKGKIEVHDPWYKPTRMTLHIEGQKPEVFDMPLGNYNGYEFEACAVMDCIEQGKTECELMPLDQTLEIMKTLDEIRAQWGFRYPSER
ncbi:MAG: gfo/Idh/MocA family oxidoreductase [Chloroflexi bacterium]|nr:MAG: gfo/Idh/MocA family oxidoreductase [Chloroflexota bacterium]